MKSGLIALLGLAVFAAATVLVAEQVGSVVALEGTATATGSDGTARDLAIKAPINMKDVVRTADGSKLQIMFNDDSMISQGPNGEMTIDEYVFNPDKKEDNKASVGLIKGVFRMVTGKITKLNPEQFGVRTKMATIGIRGCDLGFRVTETSANVYVIELHGGESITVVARDGVGKGEWDGLIEQKWDAETAKQHLINVTKPNRVVSVTEGEGTPTERAMSPDELTKLIEDVTPEGGVEGTPGTGDGTGEGTGGGAEEGAGDGTGDGTEGDTAADGTGDGTADGTTDGTAAGTDGTADGTADGTLDGTLDGTADGTLDGFTDLGDGTGALDDGFGDAFNDTLLDDGAAGDTFQDTGTGFAQDELTYDDPLLGGDTGTGDTTPPDETPPEEGGGTESVFVSQGSGDDYEWGTWELNGDYTGIEVFSPNNAVISASDFDDIVMGTEYTLTGSGSAGALINYGGETRFVSGSCGLDVLIGNNVTPTWTGNFDMNNALSDTLTFDASGTIQDGNAMVGNLDTYDMTVNSQSFGMGNVTDESFDGALLGPGTGDPPISGAMLNFFIDNDNGVATVNGVAGADLSPVIP